ncbi:MAG: UbiA family prenyltransferase, partial [Abditibacteriota bacterium]|nr:UbiA family prenyltransferase [Abditibacteriota bacterium]
MRIRHWSKSLLVFAPMLFAAAFSLQDILRTAAAFAAMCAVSSAVYIINDIADREEDKTNPLKRRRPIASGAVSVRSAAFCAA